MEAHIDSFFGTNPKFSKLLVLDMLKSICQRHLDVANMGLKEMGIEMQQLDDPKFLEEKLREEKEWSGEQSRQSATVDDLLSQIEEDSKSLRLIKISTEAEFERILGEARDHIQMLRLIQDEDFKQIIEVLERRSQGDRTRITICNDMAAAVPYLQEGQKTLATMYEFNAQMCDVLIAILSFEGNFETTPPS